MLPIDTVPNTMIRPEHQTNAESKRAVAADRLVSKLQDAKVVSVNVYVNCANIPSSLRQGAHLWAL